MHRDDLPIPEPCHADWDTMTGDERRRFCASCSKHVHDLSAMTRAEAEQTLEAEPEPCVRFETDAEGRILFLSRRRVLARTVAASALLAAAPAAASSLPAADDDSLLGRLVQRVSEWLYGPAGCSAPAVRADTTGQVRAAEPDPIVPEPDPLIPELDDPVVDTAAPPVRPPRKLMGKPAPRPRPVPVQGGVSKPVE